MLSLYFLKTDNGYKVYNQLTDHYYGTIKTIEQLDQFITYDLDGNITHQSYAGETLYGWIPRQSYKAFQVWYEAPENLDMRIVPQNDYRQSNTLRIEAIMPEPRCMASPKDERGKALMLRPNGWYHAQHCYTSFGYCIRSQCSLCPVYHGVMNHA